jgi:transcriptional regulator with XRE-family HTH domain
LVEQLREAIRRSGRSLNQIAKAAGVGSNQLSRFMRGIRTLTLPAAEKVCQVLGIRFSGGGLDEPPATEEGPKRVKKGR